MSNAERFAVAVARGESARTLFENLPEALRQRLQQGKPVRVRIRSSPIGNAWRLDEILVD